MPTAAYGSLPFAEQSEFFRRKLNLPTDGWTDIYTREHDWAFVVAGANRDAIVADFRASVEKAIAGESTLEDFRKDFDRIVATHGWDYNGGRNWRSRVIYDTNLSTSYAAGRWQQLQESPYWEYEHQDWVEHPRPVHVSWNGIVLEKDNPAWQVMFPPNGWGCNCKVRGRWLSDLVRMGKSGPDQAPQFNYVERTIGQRSALGPRTVRVPEGIRVRCRKGAHRFANSAAADAIALSDVGSDCFIVDDQTVAKTNGTNTRSVAGKTTARLREKQAIADALGVQLRSNEGLEKSFKAHQASIDAAFKDADAITQRAAAQEAANSTLGKSKTAVEQLTLAELQKQMAEAQATDSFDPKYIAGLELKIAAQQRYVNALGQADYKTAEEHANELLRNAQELGRAYEDEQQLSGMTALEREKISTNSPDFKQALSDFTLDLKQSTIQVLQTVTDIPRTVQTMLKGVDAEGLSEEAVNALLEAINAQIVGVGQLTSAFQAMGLDKLASMGFDAAAGLAAAAGGFDKLLGNLNTFYDNFYSEEERKANLQKQVDKQFAELGIDVPKNREEFRRLVEDTLEQVDVQEKARASLSKQINDAIAGAGKDGFTLADAGARSIVSGINPALLGDAQADPALAGKLNGFLSGISDLADKGLDPAAFQEGLAGLIDVNAEVLGIGKDASKTAAALLGLSGVFAELNQSAEDVAKAEADARKAATDAVWAAMQKSIAAAREAAQAEIDLRQQRLATAQAIVDLTRSQARELRGLVASTVAITAAQANAAIDAAVLAARSGQLPEQKGLQEAISAARAGMSTSAYANRLDYEAAQLILANKLDAIGDSGQAQVDVNQLLLEQAKNEVDRLDMLIKAGQAALDEARGNTLAVRDVETAVKVFYDRLFKEKEGTSGSAGAGGSAGGSGGGATFGPGGSTGKAVDAKYKTPVYLGTAGVGYQAVTDPDQIAHLDKLAPTFDKYRGTGDLEGLARDIKAAGGTAKDLAALYGFYENDVNAALDRAGIARFAMGGSHLGGVRLVGENGPELEVTGPSRIYNASQTLQLLAGLQGGGNAEVVAAIRELQRQGYDIGRTLIVLMQSMENLARKQDAIGVLKREPAAV